MQPQNRIHGTIGWSQAAAAVDFARQGAAMKSLSSYWLSFPSHDRANWTASCQKLHIEETVGFSGKLSTRGECA